MHLYLRVRGFSIVRMRAGGAIFYLGVLLGLPELPFDGHSTAQQ